MSIIFSPVAFSSFTQDGTCVCTLEAQMTGQAFVVYTDTNTTFNKCEEKNNNIRREIDLKKETQDESCLVSFQVNGQDRRVEKIYRDKNCDDINIITNCKFTSKTCRKGNFGGGGARGACAAVNDDSRLPAYNFTSSTNEASADNRASEE